VAEVAQGQPVGWKRGFDPDSAVLEDEVVDVVAERIISLSRPQEEATAMR